MSQHPDASLWEELKSLLRLALQIFGEPASLFEDWVLPTREAQRLRGWIAALEVVARALLAAMAARLPAPPARPCAAPGRATAAPATSEIAADTSEPPAGVAAALDHPCTTDDMAAPEEPPGSERWAGVAFRIAPRTRSGGRGGARPERLFLSVRSLAFRFEALIRVVESPEPYARRLARRLRAEPRLRSCLLRRPARRGGGWPPYGDLADEAIAAARAALAPPARDTG